MDRRKWLLRLIYVRFIVFSAFIPVSLSISNRINCSKESATCSSCSWSSPYCRSAGGHCSRANKSYGAQAYAQIAVDLLLITWTVNRTGGVDSYFSSLYFLAIVMSSILLERRGAFFAATVSSMLHFAHMDLAYFKYVPDLSSGQTSVPALQFIIALNIFGFCTVAYLSNFLAENWRRTGAELQKSTGQVAFLQAFSDKVVDSMGSSLVTTDVDGRIYLFNRAAGKLTARNPKDALSKSIWDVFPGLRSDSPDVEVRCLDEAQGWPGHLRALFRFAHHDRRQEYGGLRMVF